MIILAVDPGKMTGWASYDTSTEVLLGAAQANVNDFVDKILPWLDAYPEPANVRVVPERFTISGGTIEKGRTDENWSIEQIGILRHHARRAGMSFELQSAGDAKKFCDNARLKSLGWYLPGKGHANDALRHVLLNVANRHRPTFERLIAPTLDGVVR